MPEEPSTPAPDSSARDPRGQPVGSAFAGETTRSMSQPPLSGDETVIAPGTRFETVGDFEIISKLGQGGMGAVYRARQKSLDRQVALKILPATLEADADFVSRFQREARVAASLNHANLVKVYSSGAADGTHFIAMELIEGETLGDWLKRGALPPLEALRICADVARALAHGWQKAQLIHRDIKPGNIFLSIHGEVKVGDLGLAKTMGGDTTGLTQTGTAMGTPHYISPEQARGERDLDFRADIYSLGCTLYQMLTGQTPYSGGDPMSVMLQHINSPPPAILKVWPQCPIPVARLVGKMLKKAKRERHASYEELLQQIESVRALYDPSTATAPPPPPDPDATILQGAPTPRVASATAVAPGAKSKTPLYGAVAAGVVILGVVAFLVWPKEEKLTKAELYAKQREAERQLATPPPSSPAPSAPTGEWRPLVSKADWERTTGSYEYSEGMVRLRGGLSRLQTFRDGAIRARYCFRSGARNLGIEARATRTGAYKLRLGESGRELFIEAVDPANKIFHRLASYSLPQPLQENERADIEFRLVGPLLRAFLNGRQVIETRDERYASPGNWGLNGHDGWFESAEVLSLEGAAADGPAPGTAEPWQDLLREPSELSLAQSGVERTAEGLRFTTSSSANLRPDLGMKRDGAIRARMAFGGLRIQMRARTNLGGFYMLALHDQARVRLERWDATTQQTTRLREFPLRSPLQPGQEYELELRVVGQVLTAKLNGEILGTVTDEVFKEGRFAAGTFDVSADPTELKSLDFLDLDTPAMAKATATAEPWQDVLADPPRFSTSGGIQRTADGLLCTGAGSAVRHSNQTPRQDGAVRLKTIWGGVRPALRVRISMKGEADGMYQFTIWKGGTKAVITRYDNATLLSTILNEFSLPRPLKEGEPYELELRVVGQTFTAKLNGEILGSATDGTYRTGSFGMGVTDKEGAPTLVKSLEVLDLDAPAGASAAPAAERWRDTLADPAMHALVGTVERGTDGLRLGSGSTVVLRDMVRNGALRVRAVFRGTRYQLVARQLDGVGHYQLDVTSPKNVRLARWDSGRAAAVTLRDFHLTEPLAEGQEYTVELRVADQTLSAKVNGQILGSATDAVLTEGRFKLFGLDANRSPTLIKSVEVLDLDAPGDGNTAPAASPAAATKDAPFVNGLGMKFVPVPITGGPTGGKRVLFSIWETRVQDYEVFAKETKREWPKAGFTQGPDHPAVMLKWEDATAFCAWLTARERQAGRLGAGEAYRLPSDHEWSCAVGLGEQEDPAMTPTQKHLKFPDVYPWGKQYPPPRGAGNYDKRLNCDDFVMTAPVGSFAPNAFGLFDLGGNVWEYCLHWLKEGQARINRGGSHANDGSALLSSIRGGGNTDLPEARNNIGFRVVLAPVP